MPVLAFEVVVVLALGLGLVPPVQHSVCNIHAELTPPCLSPLPCGPAVGAMVGVTVPGRVEHNAAHHANQDQPYAAKDEIRAGAQSHETCPDRLIVCSRQEV